MAPRVGPEFFASSLEIKTEGGALQETYRCPFATAVAGGVSNRCGSKPVVRVVLVTGELFSCAHHYEGNEDALRKVALEIHDHRGSLG